MEAWQESKNSEEAWIQTNGAEAYRERVDVKMLQYNTIREHLPLQIIYIDNEMFFRYSVQGMASLSRLLEGKEAGYHMLSGVMRGIIDSLQAGKAFLLQEEHYILQLEFLYWDLKKKKLYVCYFPGFSQPLEDQLKELLQVFMKKTDHKDPRAVKLVYGLYEQIRSEGMVPAEIEHILHAGSTEIVNEGAVNQKRCESSLPSQQKKTLPKKQVLPKKQYVLRRISLQNEMPLELVLVQGEYTIGRGEENRCRLPAAQISRRHAVLQIQKEKITVIDQDSTNGVYINGTRLAAGQPVLCRNKDIVSFADIAYQLDQQICRVTDS